MAEGTIVILLLDGGSRHDGCNVGEDVTHGSVEDEAVNWLVEGLGEEEGDGNEGASCQGQDRSNSLECAEVEELLLGDVSGQHDGGFAEGELVEEFILNGVILITQRKDCGKKRSDSGEGAGVTVTSSSWRWCRDVVLSCNVRVVCVRWRGRRARG